MSLFPMVALAPTRRRFLAATGSAFAALVASGCSTRMAASGAMADGYGALVPDPAGLLDLPQGFSYRVISSLGDAMDDGGTVPDAADGMGCFDIGGGKLALVRNHELRPGQGAGATLTSGYGTMPDGSFMPGGTTTLVLDARTLKVERQHRSLAGTIRNCAGGVTPWGSWLTCEEPSSLLTRTTHHGYVFEVPATATGLVDPVPLKAMGRFNHEAACIDPASGMVYQTEDREDGLLYRFVPKVAGKLAEGGTLQALVIEGGVTDTRNWSGLDVARGARLPVRWIDLDDVEAPKDDLRTRGIAAGAVPFARGEGMWMGEGELYFCCTNGGAAKLGQIFRLVPGRGGKADTLELFFESDSTEQFNYGDNLVVAPNGHLVVCEDQYSDTVDNYLRGIDTSGRAYPLARLKQQTELAGACFAPDGRTLFVNAYSPTRTLAITGPWRA
ncbi:alkaline phosphatase PhoX [Altererythrobacter sp. H2]|uniref:alkaline phosphatase PhoX n=1 Tax=Altererythrobacter sp. H2 TaxID=3108391 RepID=UPI002B4BAC04|nr:alkaline phosphatase PhoX [Altererythrobacter sp. H2]WRK95507.1 alkaline phosphatase PhoX [Altererythrobacter sp. H2]